MSKYYTQQFKDESVALALESDCPYSQIAKDLGVNYQTNWKLDEKSHVKQATKVEVGDITYIRVAQHQWVYLAVVMDLYSRKVIG